MFSYIFKYRERFPFVPILLLWIFVCNTNLLPFIGINLSHLWQAPFLVFPKLDNFLNNIPFLKHTLFFGLLLFQAWSVNKLVKTHQFTKEHANFPAVCYVLLMAVLNTSYIFQPAFVASTFVILSLNSYLKSYNNRSFASIFDTAFYLSIASIIYLPILPLSIVLFLVHFFYRKFNIKEWFTTLIGLIIPWYLLLVGLYLSDYLATFQIQVLKANFFAIELPQILGLDELVFLLILFCSIIFGLYHYQRRYLRIPIEQRDKLSICLYFLAGSFVIPFIFGGNWQQSILISLPSIAIFMAYGIFYSKNKKLAEVLPLTLLLVVIFLHHFSEYFSLFNFFNP